MTDGEIAKLAVHRANMTNNMTVACVPTAPQAEAKDKSHSLGLIHAPMAA